jgi:hypothetical protein
MSNPTALIFSTDPLAAALIGAAVELSGFAAAFPAEGESARDALLRVRPAVALVDCDDEGACTEAFFGPALMMKTRVAVFSSTRSRRVLEPIATEFNVRTFSLPIEMADLSELLKGG